VTPPARASSPAQPVSAMPLVVGALLLLAPVALLGWIGGALALRMGARRGVLALAGLAPGLVAVLLLGPRITAAAAAALAQVFGLVGSPATPSWALLGPLAGWFGRWAWVTTPIGVPVGMVAAALTPAGGDGIPALPPSGQPARQRRPRRPRGPMPPAGIGAYLGGDLPRAWVQRRWLVLPDHAQARPRIVVGASGSGKSVLLGRESYIAATGNRPVVAIDCKGDAGFRDEVTGAYLAARPDARVLWWPQEPLNGWLGDPGALLGRLLQVWHFSPEAQFYREVAATVIRLAVTAPRVPPVASSTELLGRLSSGNLLRLWDGHPDICALLRSLTPRMAEVELRVLNLLASLHGALDGRRSWGDADLVVCSVPVMASPADADAAVRVLLADLAHHVASPDRKPAEQPLTILLDEFSAISGGRDAALHLTERGRSHGAATVLSVQSEAGLGDESEQERMLGAAGLLTLFRSPTAERLAKLAGTILQADYTWQYEAGQATGRGSGAMRYSHRLDMNLIRSLPPGRAAIIAPGTAGLVDVERVNADPAVLSWLQPLPEVEPEPVVELPRPVEPDGPELLP